MRQLWYLLFFLLAIGIAIAVVRYKVRGYTLQSYQAAMQQAPFDVIIVPGIPYNASQPNYMLKARLHWAVALYKRGFAKNIIFSGGAVHTAYVESKAMLIMADTLGIPAEHIFCETKAEHSNENMYYGFQLAQQLGFKKIALATDAFQSFFLKDIIDRYTPGVAQLPLLPDSINVYAQMALPTINAEEAAVNNFVPLEQRQSRWQRTWHSFRLNIKR